LKRHINLNEFSKLGMEFDIGDKTYKIDFIPAPIEEDIFSNFKELNKWFSKPDEMTSEQHDKIKDWIWQTVNFDRNTNPQTSKDDFFSIVGISERIAILTLIIELIGDRMKKMQDMFGDEKKNLTEIKT
jgi:hypothetical protein